MPGDDKSALLNACPIVFSPRRGYTEETGAAPPVWDPLAEPTPKGSNPDERAVRPLQGRPGSDFHLPGALPLATLLIPFGDAHHPTAYALGHILPPPSEARVVRNASRTW